VNEFVEECRSEWKRLGVPDPVANEMAADLAADLEEADAEGASAEDVLGSGAFDPRSFATTWAAERGVIQRPLPSEHGLARRSLLAAAMGAFALMIAIIGAVLVVIASPSAPERLAVASPVDPPPGTILLTRRTVRPPGVMRFTVDGTSRVLTLPPPPGTRFVAVDRDDWRVDTRTVGSVLLIVGLAGVVPSLVLLWLGQGRRRATMTV
jgi:hypothetical protein